MGYPDDEPDADLKDAWRRIYALRDENDALAVRCAHLQLALDEALEGLAEAHEALWMLGAREKES